MSQSRSTHERSDGARRERKAMRAYLRRQRRSLEGTTTDYWAGHLDAMANILAWIDQRRARYDKRVGGLGK